MHGIDNRGCTECTRFLPCEKHRDPRGANILLLPKEPATPRRREPFPAILNCTHCGAQHIDKGKWATFDHPKHLCSNCGKFFDDPHGRSVGVADLDEGIRLNGYPGLCERTGRTTKRSDSCGKCPPCENQLLHGRTT